MFGPLEYLLHPHGLGRPDDFRLSSFLRVPPPPACTLRTYLPSLRISNSVNMPTYYTLGYALSGKC